MIASEMDVSTTKFLRIMRYVSIGVFFISLTQSSFSIETDSSGAPGFIDLFYGALFFFTSPAAFVWFANPLLLFAWIYFFSKPKASLIISGLAVFISLSFLCFKDIRTDEGGYLDPIVKYELGYFLWVASCLIIAFANVYRRWLVNTSPGEI